MGEFFLPGLNDTGPVLKPGLSIFYADKFNEITDLL